jgi:hypothetical protein
LCLVACSSSPGSVNGTIHGVAYPVSDSVSAKVSISALGFTEEAAAISLVSFSGACADLGANSLPPNLKEFGFTLGDFNGTAVNAPAAAGTYTIVPVNSTTAPPPKFATASATVTDSTCAAIAGDTSGGTSGTVTLTSVSGDVFDGSFDITMDSGDHVTGSFSPEGCPAIQNLIGSTTAPACK